MIQLQETGNIRILAYQIEKLGNDLCGDCFKFFITERYFLCVVADGLGSGEAAHESASVICQTVDQYQSEPLEVILSHCNEQVKNKRGATVSILKVDFSSRQCYYSSIGNIRFAVYTPNAQFIYPLPVNGYLSGKPQKYRVHTFTYEPNSTFMMYTDGLKLSTSRLILKECRTVEEMAKALEGYVHLRTDDLTYIVGQLL